MLSYVKSIITNFSPIEGYVTSKLVENLEKKNIILYFVKAHSSITFYAVMKQLQHLIWYI